MTTWKIIVLALALGALAALPLGLVAVAAPYLPGFEESFREVSGHAPQLFYARSTFAAAAFILAVLPCLGLMAGTGLAWRLIRSRETALRRRLSEEEASSAALARAWLTRTTEAVGEAVEEEMLTGYQLLDRLSPCQRHLLEPAIRGGLPSGLTTAGGRGGRFVFVRIALWSAVVALLAAALLVFALALKISIANLIYQADTRPLELRAARALVGGLGLGWWGVVLVAGAAGLWNIDRDRNRWRETRERLEEEQRSDLRRHARDCLARIEASREPAPVERVRLLRSLAEDLSDGWVA